MADLLDFTGAVCHQGSNDHGRTGTQVRSAQGGGVQLVHTLKHGHLTVHLHHCTHLAQLVHIAEAVIPHALGDGGGTLCHAEQHTHQGLHIGGEARVRHGVDLQRQDIAFAGDADGIIEFLHIHTGTAELCRNGFQMLGGDIFDQNVAAGGSSGNHVAARLDLVRDDAVSAAVHLFHAAHLDHIGAGTDVIKVRGVEKMHGCTYSIIPDQIEAGSYMVAAAATGGDVLIKNVTPKHLEPITAKLRRAGVDVEEFDDSVRVSRKGDILPLKINTMPHPGFPTDMQPLMGVLLSVAKGTSTITESVWDNRFRYVDELRKMGAVVQVDGQVAVFEGVDKLNPAPLRASDLRAGAAMVVAALMADGTSEIEEIGHIERGYENIVEKLRGLGAEISKVDRMPAALESAM